MCVHVLSRVWLFLIPGTTRLLCLWNFPSKNTGIGCHFLLQGIFQTQKSNLCLLCLLHWWVYSLPLHHLRSTLIALSFRILNNSAGIPSPTLALLSAVLPKAHLSSHSRMSGSGWVTTPSQLSGSLWSFFVQLLWVFFPSLLDLFCFVRSLPFLSFIVLFLDKMFLIFLMWSQVFLLLSSSFCIVHWRNPYLSLLFCGTLHLIGCTFPFLSCFLLLFFLQFFVKPSQTATLPSCFSFSLGWFCSLPPVQYYESLSIVFQALYY